MELNASKTMIMTTDTSRFLDHHTAVAMWANTCMKILQPHETHKYLGRKLCLSKASADTELSNRAAASWGQFHKRRKWYCSRHINSKLRTKLFSACVSPVATYGICVAPLTKTALKQLGIAHRKMLRLMAGWVRLPDEAWEDILRRMKHRVANLQGGQEWDRWEHVALRRQWMWADKLMRMPNDRWPKILVDWHPPRTHSHAKRPRGHPKARWDDNLNTFAAKHGAGTWQQLWHSKQHIWKELSQEFEHSTFPIA